MQHVYHILYYVVQSVLDWLFQTGATRYPRHHADGRRFSLFFEVLIAPVYDL